MEDCPTGEVRLSEPQASLEAGRAGSLERGRVPLPTFLRGQESRSPVDGDTFRPEEVRTPAGVTPGADVVLQILIGMCFDATKEVPLGDKLRANGNKNLDSRFRWRYLDHPKR